MNMCYKTALKSSIEKQEGLGNHRQSSLQNQSFYSHPEQRFLREEIKPSLKLQAARMESAQVIRGKSLLLNLIANVEPDSEEHCSLCG